MSVIPKDSIKVIAEMVGVPNLSDDVSSSMAPDVEYRMREIVQEAIKFMKHSKRTKLTTEDINNALKLRNLETLYGYSAKEPLRFQRASKDLFFIEDREIEFQEIINNPLPKCPRDTTLGAHWLAVEGVTPPIPQNSINGEYSIKKRKATTGATSTTTASGVKVKPLVKHVLSKELQLYYEKVVLIIRGMDQDLIETAIESLAKDPGLHPLLPYFLQFISEEVTRNLQNLTLLNYLLRMIQAILDSIYFNVEPYLNQMMPPILTCLVGKQLCENSDQNHWALRDFAAKLLTTICSRYGDSYSALEPRINKTLLKALLDPSKPFSTHYGAIIGASYLGERAIKKILLPNLSFYMKHLESGLNSDDKVKQMEAKKCHDALIRAASLYFQRMKDKSKQYGVVSNGTKSVESTKTDKEDVIMEELSVENETLSPNDVKILYDELFAIFGDNFARAVTQEPLKS